MSIDTNFRWQYEPQKCYSVAIRATKQLLTPTSVSNFLPAVQLHLLEGDFAALSLLRFHLELTSKSGFSVSFQIMPSFLESDALKTTQQDKDENDEREWTVVNKQYWRCP